MRIAVLGCGNMGGAIISGLLQRHKGKVSLMAYDKVKSATKRLDKSLAIVPPAKWFAGKNVPDVVVLAVKPQDMETSLAAFKGGGETNTLWISIAAGVTLSKLETYLGGTARICRVMPNTPALIGEAISAYAVNDTCGARDSKAAEFVLSALGRVVSIPETMMDAVTGLSGSGPAYVYLFIEALIEGGVTAGLPYAVAKDCAVQTVLGAALLVRSSDKTPAELKAQVMSPGGTTARGLLELEKHGFKFGIINAVTEAAKRAAELGKE